MNEMAAAIVEVLQPRSTPAQAGVPGWLPFLVAAVRCGRIPSVFRRRRRAALRVSYQLERSVDGRPGGSTLILQDV